MNIESSALAAAFMGAVWALIKVVHYFVDKYKNEKKKDDTKVAFGKEQSPADLDTIADLQSIPSRLMKKGYSQSDIENIMHKNFISFLLRTWK